MRDENFCVGNQGMVDKKLSQDDWHNIFTLKMEKTL